MNRIYLDYAATTPLDPEVIRAMEPFWEDHFGNPSSGHTTGQDAARAIETVRKKIADFLGAESREIVFTGSGTESDNMAIKGLCDALRDRGNHIITTAIEHSAVIKTCEFLETRGFHVTYLPVGSDGIVDPDAVQKAITDQTILISVMHANNEIGTIQPLEAIGRIAQSRHIRFHTDAVQTFGHLPINVGHLHLDFLSLSAHKLYGPKGVGALFIKKDTPFTPLIHGGGHEEGRRSSTQNVPGIVGLGKAAEIAYRDIRTEQNRIRSLRDRLFSGIRGQIENVRLNGHASKRLNNNLNLSIPGVEGESLLMNLDMEGIQISSGSACSSGSGKPSHVLSALGLEPADARGSLRITLGRFTTEKEIRLTIKKLTEVVARLRAVAA